MTSIRDEKYNPAQERAEQRKETHEEERARIEEEFRAKREANQTGEYAPDYRKSKPVAPEPQPPSASDAAGTDSGNSDGPTPNTNDAPNAGEPDVSLNDIDATGNTVEVVEITPPDDAPEFEPDSDPGEEDPDLLPPVLGKPKKAKKKHN